MKMSMKLLMLLCPLLSMVGAIRADTEQPAACAGVADVKGKSRQHRKIKILTSVLGSLEAQGEANFHPNATFPESRCVFDTFEVAGNTITAIYAPLEKGERTVNWQFRADGAEPREILVLYDGLSSFVHEKTVIVVLEEHKGSILFYALFRDPPSFAVLKPMVTGIIDGTLPPIVGLAWPPGAKEAVLHAYDTDRLH